MGYAYGKLMAYEIKTNVNNFWKHYEDIEFEELSEHLPTFLARPIAKLKISLFHGLLLLDHLITSRRTP